MFFNAILALTQFIGVLYILSSTFYLHYVLMLCFLLKKNLVLQKLCIDTRPQESESLKRIYGSKLLY